ncbi:peptidoglycan-binding protein [Kitasatospora sp. NPDC056651]|uniref:peptidoglycan-binding domain-containing protein n=1 Tax=Kitasatospora sp. NPDC056651 TaxID=3345892 RepID=UPI003675B1F6
MPDQHCPTCGTARPAGCGCVPDPSLTETAVLPHIEGPPLVRPYVSQTAGQVADQAPAGAPLVDPFATAVLPPVAPGQPAVPGPPPAPPLGPDADAYATTVLPPVGPGQGPLGADAYADAYATTVLPPVTTVAGPGAHPAARPPGQPQPPAPAPDGEIGLFAFGQTPDAPGPATGGGRAARRAAEQAERPPLGQRKGLLAGVGAALVALTIGLAYAVTPSDKPAKQAQPLPTTTLAPAPVDPPSAAAPSPDPAPTSEAPNPTPTPVHKPSPTRTPAPTPTPTPTAAPPVAAPPVQTPDPVPSPPAAPSPTQSTATRTLQLGDTGPDVRAMQQRLYTASCGSVDKSLITGIFDFWTRTVLRNYQHDNKIKGEDNVYGPKTQAALAADPGC